MSPRRQDKIKLDLKSSEIAQSLVSAPVNIRSMQEPSDPGTWIVQTGVFRGRYVMSMTRVGLCMYVG